MFRKLNFQYTYVALSLLQIMCVCVCHYALPDSGPWPPLRGFAITLAAHITLSRTTLNEWTARCTGLYLTTRNTHETNIHAPGGSWTHNPSNRVAADPHPRPRGHWERPRYIQGHQKVSVHLMVTIQKVTSNVQSVPRQCPDICWHAELCSRRPCSV
jgi:hypothetical protein